MSCREFQSNHVAFVDDLLSAAETESMAEHRSQCERCARLDVRIRRSLLVARNMPSIDVSPDFMAKLNARLAAGPEERVSPSSRMTTLVSIGALATLAAGLVVAGYLATATPRAPESAAPMTTEPAMTATVATLPEPSPMADESDVGDTPIRTDVWRAMFVADRHAIRFGIDRPGRGDTGP